MKKAKYRIFMTCKNPGHLESRKKIYGTPGQSSLNPIKPGISGENGKEWDPQARQNYI
jgi:hypothetical protein